MNRELYLILQELYDLDGMRKMQICLSMTNVGCGRQCHNCVLFNRYPKSYIFKFITIPL